MPSALTKANTVSVDGGRITGLAFDKVRIYKGVPFAAPPVGNLRWKPPHPVTAWKGIRACDSYSPECPQVPYPNDSIYSRPSAPQSEDCLYLNVWTAAGQADEKQAVMVWIHGGALDRGSGSSPFYEGCRLAGKGVVVVTFNYRLGVFGYLAHPALTEESDQNSSGNYGVLDQIAALKWIQRNIGQFGGDPDNVTIFGESAGSWSVNTLVASPLAKNLFHRAIGQSGALFGPTLPLKSVGENEDSAEKLGQAFAQATGAQSMTDLRQFSAAKLIEVFTETSEGKTFRSRPNVDGWVLPTAIREIFESGKQTDVPTLIGSNADEWTAFIHPDALPKNLDTFRNINRKRFGDSIQTFEDVYAVEGGDDIQRSYLESYRDEWFTLPMRRWARHCESRGSATYLYFFAHVPPTKQRDYLGAYHAAEIPYVFQNLDSVRTSYDEHDDRIAELMSNYWVSFAKTGNPNCNGQPTWRPYDRKSESYLRIGQKTEIKQHLLEQQLDFLEPFPGVY